MGRRTCSKKPNSLILIGQRARFANQNLGWFELGDKIEDVRGQEFISLREWFIVRALKMQRNFFIPVILLGILDTS